MIGGNITLTLQKENSAEKNEIGEDIVKQSNALNLWGFLDLSSGDSKHTVYSAKVQESTHVFICDFVDIGDITAENSKAICKGKEYEVLLIDNPMELNMQLEIYLKFVGGQNG